MIPISELKNILAFQSLSPETQQLLCQRAFKGDYHAGHMLIVEGQPAEYCYFLLAGEARIIRMSSEGRVQILARLTPGAPINIISMMIDEKINRASVEALTPLSVLILDMSDFHHLLATCPDFSTLLLRIFAKRMAQITDLAAGLSLYTVRARLARFLIELADYPQTAGGWTQDEIAAHIGTVRDVVGRLLREFEAEGWIKRERQQIILCDRKGLTRQAQQPDT